MEAKLIEITEILAPDRFLIKELSSLEEVLKISEEIENHLISTSDKTCNEVGDLCCCFFKGMYHRVKIEGFIGTYNVMAKCSFIDSNYRTENILNAKLKKLPVHLIGRSRLIKEVMLEGIMPHSLLIDQNLKLEFGPARDYDESAKTFVKNLVSKSTKWLCVAKRLAFQSLSTFDVNLYYVDEENNQAVKDKTLPGLSTSLSKVEGWKEEYEEEAWSSLNLVLVQMKFACLKQEFGRAEESSQISNFVSKFQNLRGAKNVSKVTTFEPKEVIVGNIQPIVGNVQPIVGNVQSIVSNVQSIVSNVQPSNPKKQVDVGQRSTNPRHMKYNPMSQMELFGRGRQDVLTPCSVNNIYKVSPHDPILLDIIYNIEQVVDIERVAFYQFMKRDKSFCGVTKPTSLQSYAWPAILKLHDFFGISPAPSRSTENFCGGKTAAYIFPILWQINNTACYSELSQSCRGPIVIIVCPSSRQVTSIYKQISSMLDHQADLPNHSIDLTVSYSFGKSNESKHVRRRSQILVATPKSLLRMYDVGAMSFDNLCHLVFEEADILVDDFETEMERIVDGLHLAAHNRKNRATPKQVLVFSQHWTPGLDRFVVSHLTCPTVVIANKMEAFYSSGVKMDVRSCSTLSKTSTLEEVVHKQLLVANDNKKQKIVIICSQDAREIYEQLLQHHHHVILVDTSMEDEELRNIKRTFHEASKNIILVTSDDMLANLSDVSNSTCVIHLDVPTKQQTMASRLWLMRDHFQHTSARAKHVKVDESIKTILLLLEENNNSSLLCNLAIFLKRAGVLNLPNEIENATIRSSNQMSTLCMNFKSFGFCRNRHCKLRHNFNQHLDIDIRRGTFLDVPFFSVVKIKVTNVRSPFIYEAQVLEWVEQGKDSQPIQNIQSKLLAIRLARTFGCQGNRKVMPENLNCNELYAWRTESGMTFRAKVVSLEQAQIPDVVMISLVDIGEMYKVKATELFELPDSLKVVPHQVVDVCVCRLKSVDDDPNWTNRDRLFVEGMLRNAILMGRVVYKVGETLWLDPLEECEKLKSLGMWMTTLEVRKMMLEGGVAEENLDHIRLLVNASRDLDLPQTLRSKMKKNFGYSSRGQFVTTSNEHLVDRLTPVYLSAVENPHHFYVQKAINKEKLDKLHAEIEKDVKNEVGSTPLEKDMLVLVRNSCGWRRAKVVECLEEKVEVFCLDFGFTKWCERFDVLPMSMKVKDALPFQAIECSLSSLEPCKIRRSAKSLDINKSCDTLNNASVNITIMEDVNNDKKTLHTNGTSVDPYFDEDEDEDDGTTGTNAETPDHTFSEPSFKSPSHGCTNNSSIVENPKWGDEVCDFMFDATGGDIGPNLLTAVLIDSKVTEAGFTRFAVHLHGYDMGEFVTDLEQVMVLGNVASLTELAVKDMLDVVVFCGITKEIFKKKCIAFLQAEDLKTSTELAESIFNCLNSILMRDESCEKLTQMLCFVVKFNMHWLNFEPIMKALTTLFETFPGHCLEARQGYLWDSICFHLCNETGSPEFMKSQVIIIRSMKKLLSCKTCCREFIKKGGMKVLCRTLKNLMRDGDHVRLCLGLLRRLIQCDEESENIQPIRIIVDDDDDDDDDIMSMDKLSNRNQDSDYESGFDDDVRSKVFDILANRSQEDDDDNDDNDDNDELSDSMKRTRLIELHRELNAGDDVILRNIERNTQVDLLECLEVVTMVTKQGTRGEIWEAMLLLGCVLERDVGDVILRFKENDIVDGIFDILEQDVEDSELLELLLSLVQIMVTRRSTIKKHIFSFGQHNILQKIHHKADGQIKQLSSELITKCNVLKSDDSGVKNIGMTSHADLKRSRPAIHWSDAGTKLRLRIEAKQVVPESLDVVYSDHSISFRAYSDTEEYSFDLALSDAIIPTECSSTIHHSEVMMMITKSSTGTWKRLTPTRKSFVKHDLDDLVRRLKEEEEEEKDDFKHKVAREPTNSDDEDLLNDDDDDDQDDYD